MFQNAIQMFCNDFEMVFNEYFVSLKCIVNVPKRVDNVFKMHSQRLKMHCQWKMVQRSFLLRVVFANRVTYSYTPDDMVIWNLAKITLSKE